MAVDMKKTYIGKVVEVIKDGAGDPTLGLRVRVPSIHGISGKAGLADEDLPIAEPIIFPGSVLTKSNFLDMIEDVSAVYVMFEAGSMNRLVYFGLRGREGMETYLDLEQELVDHDNLSEESRGLPDQHPIDAISGLRQKLKVHIGKDAPQELNDVWFRTEDPDVPAGWNTVVSTPEIAIDNRFNFDFTTTGSPPFVRLLVEAEVWGEVIAQEFHNDGDEISGEATILVTDTDTTSAQFTLVYDGTGYEVTEFVSTGSVEITSFYGLRIEEYV